MPDQGTGAGSYYRPLPMDYLLLAKMPEEGTIGGIHWKGRRAKDLRDEINEELGASLTSSQVMARLRSMHTVHIVKPFAALSASGTQIWARTPKGTKILDEHQAESAEEAEA